MLGDDEGLVAINEVAQGEKMRTVRPLITSKREADAVEGQRVAFTDCSEMIVARTARAEIVLGVNFEPETRRRVAERIGIVLRLQSESGGGLVRHDYMAFGVSEPMPFGVLIVVQVPAFTSDQALA